MIQLSRPRIWANSLLVAALLCTALFYFLWRPQSAARMLAMLPAGDGPTLFADISLLRRAGVLDQLAGQAGAEEPDYLKFVQATAFNYRTDLDAVLIRFRAADRLMVLAGRFQDDRLRDYARRNGGRCAASLCSVQGSAPERQVSWLPLRRGLLALAVSADPMAAALIGPSGAAPVYTPPDAPVWLYLPESELHPREGLPPGLSSFLSALEGARSATLQLHREPGDTLAVVLEAPAADPVRAAEISVRLVQSTEMLNKLLNREGRKPDPSELSGVLAAGAFQSSGSTVRGRWPLPAAFLARLGRQ